MSISSFLNFTFTFTFTFPFPFPPLFLFRFRFTLILFLSTVDTRYTSHGAFQGRGPLSQPNLVSSNSPDAPLSGSFNAHERAARRGNGLHIFPSSVSPCPASVLLLLSSSPSSSSSSSSASSLRSILRLDQNLAGFEFLIFLLAHMTSLRGLLVGVKENKASVGWAAPIRSVVASTLL